MKNQSGFTLIELVLVVVLLGIIAIAALPSFISIYDDAAVSQCAGSVGAIRAGLSIYRTNNMVKIGPPGVYPSTLDSATEGFCSTTNRCFGTVIMNGIGSDEWSTPNTWYKWNSTSYNCSYEYADGGSTGWDYTYIPSTGEFAP